VHDVVVKKVYFRCLISWWAFCNFKTSPLVYCQRE